MEKVQLFIQTNQFKITCLNTLFLLSLVIKVYIGKDCVPFETIYREKNSRSQCFPLGTIPIDLVPQAPSTLFVRLEGKPTNFSLYSTLRLFDSKNASFDLTLDSLEAYNWRLFLADCTLSPKLCHPKGTFDDARNAVCTSFSMIKLCHDEKGVLLNGSINKRPVTGREIRKLLDILTYWF